MQNTSMEIWQPDFLDSTPLFKSLRSVAASFAGKSDWSTLLNLAAVFNALIWLQPPKTKTVLNSLRYYHESALVFAVNDL